MTGTDAETFPAVGRSGEAWRAEGGTCGREPGFLTHPALSPTAIRARVYSTQNTIRSPSSACQTTPETPPDSGPQNGPETALKTAMPTTPVDLRPEGLDASAAARACISGTRRWPRACITMAFEIIDNAVDEVQAGYATKVELT